jgi:hypothetical protein
MDLILALLLYWNVPTTRVDGMPLYSNEISHYEMYYNGAYYDQTANTQMEVTGYGDFQVRTVDIEGQVSDFSNTVSVTQEKGKPSAPGQLRKNR